MSLSTAARIPRDPSFLIPALFLALLAHGLWYYLYARKWTPLSRVIAASQEPSLLYISPAQGQPIRDERALGSPVLFALPSRQGFSDQTHSSAPFSPAPLRAARSEVVMLGRPSGIETSLNYLRPVERMAATVPEAAQGRVETAARAIAAKPGSTGYSVRVYWPDGAPAVRSGLPGAGLLAPALKDRPWELTALLEFDAQGSVRSVFLEKPTALRENNEFLGRVLRGIRIENGGVETRARVTLQYDQDATLRTVGAGGTRP